MPHTIHTLHENANAEPFAAVLPGVPVWKAVMAFTGRQPGHWLSRELHRKGSCYCAGNRRLQGIVVRRVKIGL